MSRSLSLKEVLEASKKLNLKAFTTETEALREEKLLDEVYNTSKCQKFGF